MDEIRVRRSIASDHDFLWWLHRVTMKEYVDRTWGWDEEFQALAFRKAFATDRKEVRIVESAGERIGYLRVAQEPSRFFLAAIEIAPSHQGRGIGTSLIEGVCKRADSLGLPVELQVLKVNPARQLYERLGFLVQGETATHTLMRRDARSAARRGIGARRAPAGRVR